jgi:hypothetical protein
MPEAVEYQCRSIVGFMDLGQHVESAIVQPLPGAAIVIDRAAEYRMSFPTTAISWL